MNLSKPEVAPNAAGSGWNVEQLDGEGTCYMTIFCGPDDEQRAREYASKMLSAEQIVDSVLANFGLSKSGLDGSVKADEFDEMRTYTARSIARSLAS